MLWEERSSAFYFRSVFHILLLQPWEFTHEGIADHLVKLKPVTLHNIGKVAFRRDLLIY